MIDDRKRLFARGALLSGLETPPFKSATHHYAFCKNLLGSVPEKGANTSLAVFLGLLLGFFEDEFGNVPVEVFVRHHGRD